MNITISVDGNDCTNPQIKIKGTDIIARVHSIDFRFGKVVAMFIAEGESRLCTYNFSETEWIQSTPSPSRGFTVEEMQLCFGYAFGLGQGGMVELKDVRTWYEKFLASLPHSKVEGEEWVKCEEGNPLPDYDVPVLWLQENGNMVVEALDKDGNPWIFEGQTFEGSYMGNKATHWRYLPAPTKQ